MLHTHTAEEVLTVEADTYALRIHRHQPVIDLLVGGQAVAALHAASGLDTTGAADEDTYLGAPELRREQDAAVVAWRGSSALWPMKEVKLRADAAGFSYGYRVQGRGRIDRAHLFRTRAIASSTHFTRLFNPDPNLRQVQYSGAVEPARITLYQDDAYQHGSAWFFTPPPFSFAFEVGPGAWLAAGIAAQPGAWSFTDLGYPGGGFGLSLWYGGHLAVDGAWESPRLLVLPAGDEYAALQRYADGLRAAGLAPTHGRGPAHRWWYEPIFCGWGAQVALERHGGGRAADHATQANYERWLEVLAAHSIVPGTLVIDDKWQRSYARNEVDQARWPDLPGFVAAQHDQGRRVLLWLKAWDPEGAPIDECMLDADGRPVAVDPGQPAYAARHAAQIRHLLRDVGADGFKLDFTQLVPHGPGLRSAGGRWGLELQRQWLEIVSDAARDAKPDALLVAHTTNPYLADLVDVLRLNDLPAFDCAEPERSVLPAMRHRARIARAASPFWLLEADNWPCCSRAQWREYVRAQGSGAFGIPSLYYAERMGWGPTDEPLMEEDYAAVRTAWAEYRSRLSGQLE